MRTLWLWSHGEHLSYKQILRELLTLDAATITCSHPEPSVQEPCDGLYAVQFTVAVQRESDHMPGVMLVPGDAGSGIQKRLVRLWEYFIEQGSLPGQHNALPQVRADMQRHTLILLVLLVVRRLLVLLLVVLRVSSAPSHSRALHVG